MLSERRAQALTRRADRPRGDGGRGARARRAWRVLTAHADRGDYNAVDAVWQAWLREPGDELWEALTRWRKPTALASAVFAAATEPGRDPAARTAIGEFCLRHSLAPDDPVRRALFYLVTGQPAQHRAADPDGRLLAAAYEGADLATRAAVREALADAGDADLIWAVANAGQRAKTLPRASEETEYLIRQLACRSDWSRLWQLVMQLPLTDAVAAVRRFGGGWHPESEPERTLFGRLACADPGELAHARDALAWSTVRVQFAAPHSLWGGAVSADARLLALVRSGSVRNGATISVHEVPCYAAGYRVRHEPVRHELPPSSLVPLQMSLAFAGEALIVACVGRPARHPDAMLLRYRDAGFEPLADLQAALGGSVICGLAPCFDPPGGFAIVCEKFVAFCHGDGRLARRMPISLRPADNVCGLPLVDVEPGGRIAIAGFLANAGGDIAPGWEVYDTNSGQKLASATHARMCRGIRFLDPDRLVLAEGDEETRDVRLWEFGKTWAQCPAAAIPHVRAPVIVPGDGRICVLGNGTVHVLDAATLQQTGTSGGGTGRDASLPLGFPGSGEYVTMQWNSAGNTAWVTAGRGFADVFPGRQPVIAIADRRPAEWVPADLAAVTAALADPALAPEARPLLDLLRAGLGFGFGTEVRVGTAAPVPGHDDIGLAAGGDRPC